MQSYLLVVGVTALALFAVPLLLAPLSWARLFRWDLPADVAGRRLATYFGRCLGAIATALAGACTWAGAAATTAAAHGHALTLLCATGATLLTLIHIAGALARTQPWTETAEIPFWAAIAAIGFAVL